MEYTDEQIEACRRLLETQPPAMEVRTKHTKIEVVKMLLPEIIDCQNRGYTLAQIREMLVSHGIEIAQATLNHYINLAKKEHGNGRKKVVQSRHTGAVIQGPMPGSSVKSTDDHETTPKQPEPQSEPRLEDKVEPRKSGSFEVYPDTDDL